MAFVPIYIKAVVTNYFGSDVGLIAEALCAGPKPYSVLYRKVVDQLTDKTLFRKQLTLLYWHHIVEVQTRDKFEMYSIKFENVFRFAMLPSMLVVLEQIAGPGSLIMAQACILAGRISASDLIRQSKHDAKDVQYDFERIFSRLVEDKVLMRTKSVAGESEMDPFLKPTVILDGVSRIAKLIQIDAKMEQMDEEFLFQAKQADSAQQAAKLENIRRQKRQELYNEADQVVPTDSDADILWKINYNILDRLYRDRLLLELLIKDAGIDVQGEKIMRAVFGYCMKMQDGDGANTGQRYFTRQDIENILKENPDITNDDFDATFYLVSSSADRFIEKSGDGRGGVFKLDYNEGMKTLVTKALTSMIDSKYENSQEADERKGLPVFVFTALLKRGLVEEDKLPIVLKHPLNELLQEISRLKADGFVNVVTKDPSYEFHPKECGFLYGVDLLKVARNQLQIVLQYQANYINRRLYEKSQIVPTKIHKQKVARMIEYVKKTCPEEEMEEMLQDVNNEFDHGKRTKIRRYRQFRDYLKKVEMMLNESIWVIYKYQQIEERRRKDQGVSNTKTRKRGPTSYDNDSEAKRFKY